MLAVADVEAEIARESCSTAMNDRSLMMILIATDRGSQYRSP